VTKTLDYKKRWKCQVGIKTFFITGKKKRKRKEKSRPTGTKNQTL